MTEPARWAPIAERIEYGKLLRERTKRADQGRWDVPVRDVRDRLRRAEKDRQPDLLAIKYGKMATGPFAFLRGGAAVMAPDLAAQPNTGYRVQICGDAHVRNLGAYATADSNIVFDINDFDETCRAPWEWDLRKLAISLVLVGREAGCDDRICRDAAREMMCAWREAMWALVETPIVDLGWYRVRRHAADSAVGRTLEKAERVTPSAARDRWAAPGPDGLPRFTTNRVDDALAARIIGGLVEYRETLGPARQQTFDGYRPYDVARRIAGTGSLGVQNYMVLCEGNDEDDPLILQVKQAIASCYQALELVPPDPKIAAHHGRRIAEGQHRMQSQTDPFLGWTTIDGVPFVVRQLADHQASIDPRDLGRASLVEYARVCGETFAKGHAKSGDPAILAGYVGNGDNVDRAIGELALRAGDQVTADWEVLVKAIERGEFIAATEG